MADQTRLRLSVLMPVYNEQRTLREIVARVLQAPVDLDIELICVDDCSSDRSLEVLHTLAEQEPRIKVFSHTANRGKGAAIRTAISHMTGEIAVVQDSDLEYDPADFPKLLNPILDGRADAVFGSRFAASPERRVLLYWHSLGNKLLTLLTNVLNDLNLTDMETCYKAVSADVLGQLRLQSDRFGIEPEMTTRLAQWGARIYEVPISYHGRGYAEGKNIGWRDGVQALWLLVKYRFFDTRFTTRSSNDAFETSPMPSQLSKWYFEQVEPFLGRRVLEVGSGPGNLTRLMLGRDLLTAIDIDRNHIRAIDRKWGHLENFKAVEGDLEDPSLYEKLEPRTYDSILCVNVLEHVRNPGQVLRGLTSLVVPEGESVFLVPSDGRIFGSGDLGVGHRRRFDRRQIVRLLEDNGWHVEQVRSFNRLARLGWIVAKAAGVQGVRPWQVRTFAWLLPLARLLERVAFLPGLSMVVTARVR